MKYPLFEQMNVRIRKEQKAWLYQEADKQEANISVIVRQAIKLYKNIIEKRRKETDVE